MSMRRLTFMQFSQRTLIDGRTFMPVSRSYLNRYVIRPRVRSYGDNSTFTRSPGRMRMKFMRILPLTCASTRWPLSSSTRNIAFGSGSTTVPSTSIASSLGMRLSGHLDGATRPARQDFGLRLRDGDRVLEVGGQAAVPRHRRPAIVEHLHFPAPHRHHRLDRQHHARPQLRPAPRVAEVRHLGTLVQRAADSVADERPHDREAVPLHVRLDRVRDVGEAPARPALLDGLIEALAGDVEQLLHLRGHVADGEGERAVRVVPVHDTPEVQADDIAVLDAAVGRGNPVHDLLVDRDADGGREAAVALEGRPGAARRDEALHVLVDLERRQTRLHEAAQVLDDVGEDMAGRAHQTDLAGRLQLDHCRAPCVASSTRRRMSAIGPSPGTETSRPRPRYQSSSGAVCRAYTPRRWRTVASVSSSRW